MNAKFEDENFTDDQVTVKITSPENYHICTIAVDKVLVNPKNLLNLPLPVFCHIRTYVHI